MEANRMTATEMMVAVTIVKGTSEQQIDHRPNQS
jgi:hypothetical protein